MRKSFGVIASLLCLAATCRQAPAQAPAAPGPEAVRSPGTAAAAGQTGAGGKPSAPGADEVMTPDLLLIGPPAAEGAPAPRPLKEFVGTQVTLKVERADVQLGGLRGVKIAVVNDTSRPLVADGDSAQAVAGGKRYGCASVTTVQKSVRPDHNAAAAAAEVIARVVPAAVTVGLAPTVESVVTSKKPIQRRYGVDEARRIAEASRFGQRILWPREKTEGIVYFQTGDTLTGTTIEMPVHTLFDATDAARLSGGQ